MSQNPPMSLNAYKELCTRVAEQNKEAMSGLLERVPFTRPPDRFLEYLKNSDFYYAPGSTIFHDSVVGGLFNHSLKVLRALNNLNKIMQSHEKFSPETLFYSAIGHDLCKIDFYFPTERFRKDAEGKWEKYLTYEVRDAFPFGHGEKSAFILSKFVDLKQEELLAIRWHMGAFDLGVHDKTGGYAFKGACEFSPLVSMLHSADLLSTYIF